MADVYEGHKGQRNLKLKFPGAKSLRGFYKTENSRSKFYTDFSLLNKNVMKKLFIGIILTLLASSWSFPDQPEKITVTLNYGCNKIVYNNCIRAEMKIEGIYLYFPDGTIRSYSHSVIVVIERKPN